MKVTAIVEKSKDGLYSVYVRDELPGFGLNGQGESVEEAKSEMLEAFSEIKEILEEQGKEVPELEFEYEYDLQSFFNYFNWINVSKLAEKVGINPALLRHYKKGIAFASEKQCEKIQRCIHELGGELTTAKF